MDDDFLMTLDADLSVQDFRCQIVDEYGCAWWEKRKPRNMATAEIFNKSSMEKCLESHHTQLFGDEGLPPKVPNKQRAAASDKRPSATNNSNCDKCVQYGQILADTLQDLLDAHNTANAMSTSFEIQWNLDMRRASTFNLLHEAAVVKEMAGPSSASSMVLPANVKVSVAESAKHELNQLMALPTSYKWTWGERLTKDKVLALYSSGTRPIGLFYSGYDLSLKDGIQPGYDLSSPSMPKTIDFAIQDG